MACVKTTLCVYEEAAGYFILRQTKSSQRCQRCMDNVVHVNVVTEEGTDSITSCIEHVSNSTKIVKLKRMEITYLITFQGRIW